MVLSGADEKLYTLYVQAFNVHEGMRLGSPVTSKTKAVFSGGGGTGVEGGVQGGGGNYPIDVGGGDGP
jgi:hypothetical protein